MLPEKFLSHVYRQEKLNALQRQFFEEAAAIIAWGNIKLQYLTTVEVVETLVAAQIQVFFFLFK